MTESVKDTSERPTRYYEQTRPEMLKYVPAGVKRTLELGCALGGFSATVKQQFSAECWGMELDPEAAQVAAGRLDRVIVGDIVEHLGDLPDHHFDCVICNDILEHLVDPYTLLMDLRTKLTPQGVVVASLPNIRYCRILFDLVVRGNWDYKEHGILDKTHLRFFTYKSLKKVFPKLGYELLMIEGLEPEPTWPARLVKILNLLLFNVFVDTRFHHFACVARPVR